MFLKFGLALSYSKPLIYIILLFPEIKAKFVEEIQNIVKKMHIQNNMLTA